MGKSKPALEQYSFTDRAKGQESHQMHRHHPGGFLAVPAWPADPLGIPGCVWIFRMSTLLAPALGPL